MGLWNVESSLQQHAKDNMIPLANNIISYKQTSIVNFTLSIYTVHAIYNLDM